MKKFNFRGGLCRAAAVATAFFIGASPITAFAYVDPEAEAEEEVVEETPPEETPIEEYGPLTPDGNMELVDDYGTLECGGKQFITVVTKSGHYFYIIIDRDDDGNENVHFLNMVDERDLLTLMDDEEVEEYMASIAPKEEEVKEEPVPEPVPVEPEPEKKTVDFTGLLYALPIMGIAAIVGYFVLKNKKKQPKDEPDPDADYIDEEDDYLSSLSEDEEEGDE